MNDFNWRRSRWSQDMQSRISRFCRKNGLEYHKTTSSRNGLMDVAVVIDSCTLWIEVKHPDDKESPLQAERRRRFNQKKEVAYVVKYFSDFLKALDNFIHVEKLNKKLDISNERIYAEEVTVTHEGGIS